MEKQVIIYSSPTCHFCNQAKAFFKEHNIAYTDFNVVLDPAKRQEMIEKSGQMGTPVIFVGDEMIVGFNESKLKELLSI
ncbi:MAG: NrdH-redoxin [Candidatus Lloydbacteria bacterium CG22_combo_CG10-13_8_21_14_all_47_15]|uniref:NrdH-redoxin n=1 Tax=Candidatus Lloydbacteria bacterium CG22_combo_CG10-13_8_21_14_all_47_15 TaxID=1974635 RepID=A0A2H0CUK8_9BACT|nr:MAG: NrdH-redoxin [Candidatus Lloydbacteria bacterium CG22_combo_CG10-13_8_21_14_all_47_15]